ncbi:hypothetical protein MYE70_10680 [Marinobacter alexandrii]|uniref:hypothetical protein n=1 Tax=Marinobacter alexandrii TaxID=2570351 RepID=UPI001FFF4526|nr:hypothetical protein [Marinobacter alexandrii]MCK2149531.1 hypothetical protein [Marinobacter alexandrii]
MAAIVATDMKGFGDREVTITTLAGTDSFTYDASKNPVLILNNVTAGALTVTIDGDGASSVTVPGAGTFDISGGFPTASIPIGAVYAIPLNSIGVRLAGTIAVTGGAGIEASLLEF